MAGTIPSLIRGARVVAHWLRPTAWDAAVAGAVEVLALVAHLPVAVHIAVAAVAFVGAKLTRPKT
jgi:hypothetical protein